MVCGLPMRTCAAFDRSLSCRPPARRPPLPPPVPRPTSPHPPGNTPLHLAVLHDQLIAAHTLLQAFTPLPPGHADQAAHLFAPSGTRPSVSLGVAGLAAGVAGTSSNGGGGGGGGVDGTASLTRWASTATVAAGSSPITAAWMCARTNRIGDTPLHIAARWGYANMVALLSMHGSPLDVRNARGETPQQLAHNVNLLDLLESTERQAADARPRSRGNSTSTPAASAPTPTLAPGPTLAPAPAPTPVAAPSRAASTSTSIAMPTPTTAPPSGPTPASAPAPTPLAAPAKATSTTATRGKSFSRLVSSRSSAEPLAIAATSPTPAAVAELPASAELGVVPPSIAFGERPNGVSSGATMSSSASSVATVAAAAAGPLRRASSGYSKRIEHLFRAIEDGDLTLIKFHLGLSGDAPAAATPEDAAAAGDAAVAAVPESLADRVQWIESQLCHPLCQCQAKCARLQVALLQATTKGTSTPSTTANTTTTSSAADGDSDAGAAAARPPSPQRASEPLSLQCRGAGGLTPLHVAAIHGQTAVVELLIARHAAVDAVSDQGR